LCIQPDEGIHLKFEAKQPDTRKGRAVHMEFHYATSFGTASIPEAYERLLYDALLGDPSLFTRSDGIEAAWRFIDPIIGGWQNSEHALPLVTYAPGSWGPTEADELLERDGHHWYLGCLHEDG
ncbi:MAG: glucose-6-phosphate dehydrogenase, partial [Chloroflexi bacterium]